MTELDMHNEQDEFVKSTKRIVDLTLEYNVLSNTLLIFFIYRVFEILLFKIKKERYLNFKAEINQK